MSQNEKSEISCADVCEKWPFMGIFKGFRSALQWEKMLLAVAGVMILFVGGWVLERLPGAPGVSVLTAPGQMTDGMNELELYAQMPGQDYADLKFQIQQSNEEQLKAILEGEVLGCSREKSQELIRKGQAASVIEDQYEDLFDEAVVILESRYERGVSDIKHQYNIAVKEGANKATAARKKESQIEQLGLVYEHIFQDIVSGKGMPGRGEVEQLVQVNPSLKGVELEADRKRVGQEQKVLANTASMAKGRTLVKRMEGVGLFTAWVDFKFSRMHRLVSGFLMEGNLSVGKAVAGDFGRGMGWTLRYHPIFTGLLMLMGLAVWSFFGGAICRITAMESTRDEQIGCGQAMKFSCRKFKDFFAAPLIPMVICAVIGMLMWLVAAVFGGLGWIWVGDILGGLLLFVAIIGGLMIAFLLIGLIGGYNLMLPSIAVEGSGGFDAFNRSFSYLYSRPWRMGFYTLVEFVYGGICYLFARLFVSLALIAVYVCAGAGMNMKDSSRMMLHGKLEAMWPRPSFDNLVGGISWTGMNWSETVGAFFMLVWVAILVAVLLGFVVSFYFSVNTKIYLLMRKAVDGTDMEDVFTEEDMEDLLHEEEVWQEGPGQDQAVAAKPAEPEDPIKPPAEKNEGFGSGDSDDPGLGQRNVPEEDPNPGPQGWT